MNNDENIIKQLQLNHAFRLIVDGSVESIIDQLNADKTPHMQIEITLLRKIYEKFMEAKPLIEQLQLRGTQIVHAKNN